MNLQQTIKRRIAKAKGLRRLARELGIDPAYLCRVAKGDQSAGPAILDALGIERTVGHRKISVDR